MEQNEVQGIKISQLDELTSIQDDDVLASVDTSEIKTTKVKASTLKSYINKEVNNEITTIKNDYALKTSIPTKTSQLNNDSGFIDKSVNNLDNYYKKTEIDIKIQTINQTTNGLNTRLTTAEKNIETNKTDIKDLSNRTKRIETDIFDSGEASGTGINLQDSTLAEFQEVKIDGVGNQVTTTGKNLANYNDSSTLPNFNIADIEADTTYTLYLNINGYQSFNLKYDSGNGEIIKAEFNLTGKQCITFTTTKAGILYMNAYGSSSGSFKSFDEIMLVKGEYNTGTIGEYEPYTGGEPSPSPDYKQPIEVIEDDFDLVSCGSQLIDFKKPNSVSVYTTYSFEDDTLIVSNTEGSYQTVSFVVTNLIKNNKGKKVCFTYDDISIEGNTIVNLVITDDVGTHYNALVTSSGVKRPYTIPEDTSNITLAYLTIYPNNSATSQSGKITITKPLVYFGELSSPPSYEPYTETRQTITMPEGEFAGKIDDTYKDQFRINYNEQDGKYHLYLDKVVGKKVLNGSDDENMSYQDTYNRFSLFNFIKYNIENRNKSICNYYRYGTNKNGYFAFSSDGKYIFIYDYRYNKILDYKNWLSTHNTEVYYVLAEPYTLDLGVVNMPLSYYPITNVYNTCVGIPNMYVKYYRDFKKTITTMQVDIQELKSTIQELTSNQANLLSQINTLQENQVVEEESEVVTQ